jgi:hypothetical protein
MKIIPKCPGPPGVIASAWSGVVAQVIGDHGAAFGPGQAHHLGIGQRDPAGMVGDGEDVVSPFAELARDGGRQHLIEQQPHGLMASCPADQAA